MERCRTRTRWFGHRGNRSERRSRPPRGRTSLRSDRARRSSRSGSADTSRGSHPANAGILQTSDPAEPHGCRIDPPADPAALIRSSPRAASTTNTTRIAARSATVPRRAGGASRPRRIDADPVILAISSSASGSTAYTERSEDSTERAEPCAVAGAWLAHHGMSRIRPATGTRWTASARLPLPSARHAEQTRPSRAGYPVSAR